MLYIILGLAGGVAAMLSFCYLKYRQFKLKHAEQAGLIEQHLVTIRGLEASLETATSNNAKLEAKVQYQQMLIDDFGKMREESLKSTKAVLYELGQDLSKNLIEIHKKENNEARRLSEEKIEHTAKKFNGEFEKIVSMVGALASNVKDSKETVDMVKSSLLSPSGAGALAEITLENIFKASGLRSAIDYSMQHHMHGEAMATLRPDAVVYLPGRNVMIIDAKSSKFLVGDELESGMLAKTMNTHLKQLSNKAYAENFANQTSDGLSANVITLMFVPTEQAIEKIMVADSDFMNKAWAQNIFPVGPTGLMNMLSFAKFQISEQLMFENQQKIIEEVKKLIMSIGTLTDHSNKLGNAISSLVNSYDRFAGSFNRNFLAKAKSIRKLGIDARQTGGDNSQASLSRYQIVSTKEE